MITVAIRGAEFFAYHGFYPEEQLLGGRFIVDVEISFNQVSRDSDEIDDTVNYETVYQLIDDQMKHTRKLIETVAQAIANDIKKRFPVAQKIVIAIKKSSPPLKGKVAWSEVLITQHTV